jgi:quercetin dioxygenase-like cupin family protein
MAHPKIDIGHVANVFIRMMTFEKAGDVEEGHTHDFDHVTLLSKGSLKVISDGKETVFVAPHMIFIRKDKHHELIALEDGTVACCIHGTRDDSGDIIDPNCIP